MTKTPVSKPDKMIKNTEIESLEQHFLDWEAEELAEFLHRLPESKKEYRSASGRQLKRIYTALDTAGTSIEEIGLPGRYPFTRGPYPTMYRGRNWTMRQIAGFGTGSDTNKRYKFLLESGQTGLSTDFDMPTLMGYDSDHPMAHGEVGREGVAIDTLDDMEALFEDIDLTKISVSMTINPSAWILYAMYIALAEGRGYDLNKLSGTIQGDILRCAQYEAIQSDKYFRLPYLGSGCDCRSRGSFYYGKYHSLCR